ncbi:MAG TPA: hypothetical protein VHA53_02460, partial [Nitrolancea sp.]|nr:hypothetical protein [Nitrolancea sp.]
VDPCFLDIPSGNQLVRLYNPSRRNTTPLAFRSYGPLKRFDHHRGNGGERQPDEDPERAVYYAAWSGDLADALASCIVEIFGDTGIVETEPWSIALPTLVRPLRLLDLRGHGAMRAGTVAAIAKCEHMHSQPWSRYFYDTTSDFDTIDGLIYLNAHNDGDALMLYERGRDALRCDTGSVLRLDDPALRPLLLQIMRANNLVW